MKKKKLLSPISEKSEGSMSKEDLFKLAKGIENSIQSIAPSKEETFFKQVAGAMLSPKDIELKTEYLNIQENFASAKLEWLAIYGNMPYLSKFINILERKRVSFNRKGRKEVVLMMQEKHQEIRENNQKKMESQFGV